MTDLELLEAARLLRLRLCDRPSARPAVVRRIKARWRLALRRKRTARREGGPRLVAWAGKG